jgi:hypothetical protein
MGSNIFQILNRVGHALVFLGQKVLKAGHRNHIRRILKTSNVLKLDRSLWVNLPTWMPV